MSTSAEHLVACNAAVERRFYRRIVPPALIYIAFSENNVGMLLNVSENGLLVSTPLGLTRNFVYRVSLRLNGLATAINVRVRIVWATESKQRAGIQLLDLCDYDREQIRKWGALEDPEGVNSELQAEIKPLQGTADPLAVGSEPSKKSERVDAYIPASLPGSHANASV